MNTTIARYLAANEKRFIDELFELLRIPSVSMLPERKTDILHAAQWVKSHMEGVGLRARVVRTAGHPLVYGEKIVNPNAKTILFYGHYDVQPADPLGEWKTDPFEPVIRSGKIYARGVTDNKAQFFVHLKAVEAFLRTGALPVNVKFLVEGEEELGSPGISAFVHRNKKLLAADVAVVSDGPMPLRNVPALFYSLRGIVYLQVEIQTARHDAHSGLYGGVIDNPAIVLAHIIAKLKDGDGKVLVPGFYDAVRTYSARELRDFLKIPISEKSIRAETGAAVFPAYQGKQKGTGEHIPLQVRALRPSLDVNGIWGGYTGEGSKTIIPAQASAKISIRIVPDQRVNDVVRRVTAYIKRVARSTARVRVRVLSHSAPYVLGNREYLAPAREATRAGFGKTPVLQAVGGSIGVVVDFKHALGIDTMGMDIGWPDDNLHAPNEKFELENLRKGMRMSAAFIEGVGRMR